MADWRYAVRNHSGGGPWLAPEPAGVDRGVKSK